MNQITPPDNIYRPQIKSPDTEPTKAELSRWQKLYHSRTARIIALLAVIKYGATGIAIGHFQVDSALKPVEEKFNAFAKNTLPDDLDADEEGHASVSFSPPKKYELNEILRERDRVLEEQGAIMFPRGKGWTIKFPLLNEKGHPNTGVMYVKNPVKIGVDFLAQTRDFLTKKDKVR